MKHILIVLISLNLVGFAFGQKIYRSNEKAYKSTNFLNEFYLFNDSTCFLKENYADNSSYCIFKGNLKKTNDTLYEFTFQPMVIFGCDKRYEDDQDADSIRFGFSQQDTIIESLTYKIITGDGTETSVQLKSNLTKVYVKGASKSKFSINTKFVDPLTKKLIYMTVDPTGEPGMMFYGSKTPFQTVQLSIINKKMTFYSDYILIPNKGVFILK